MSSSLAAMLMLTLGLGISSLVSIGRLSRRFYASVNKTAKAVVFSDGVRLVKSDMFAAQRRC